MSFFSQKQRMGAAALILAASTILSRLMGLVRDKVISWQFGAGSEADMYFAAFVVPDIINHLLAGGIMAITIIPLLSRRFQEDEDDGWRFFSCIFCWMVVASLLVTGAGMLGAEELARITAPGFDAAQTARLAFFMRIILPAQVFFLCGACVTALLYMRRQFRVPALAPLIYNGCIIAGGLLLPWLTQGMDLPAEWELGGMTGYCVGVTVGALCWTISSSHRSSSVTAWAQTILQQSTTLPPPTASTRSMWCSRASRAPSRTLAKVGLDMMPENSVTVLPAAFRMPVSSS